MYEDAWYSFVPEVQQRGRNVSGHRRRESLLQQPNGTNGPADAVVKPLDKLLEEDADDDDKDDPFQARAAALGQGAHSFSDLKSAAAATAARARPTVPTSTVPNANGFNGVRARAGWRRRKKKEVTLEALSIADQAIDFGPSIEYRKQHEVPTLLYSHDSELLEASQQEFLLYRDQLELTERHLGRLIDDTSGALQILSSLADSFRSVEEQTTSFQSQCDDLLSEQRRLETLADEVGTDLHYYTYLDNVSRRLNSPGASRLVDDEAFSEILQNLNACIAFMAKHPTYRDAESYLARYQSLLTKALHILEVGFTARLEKISGELSKQIAATQSESARHALAYGRFEELLVDGSYSLVPNVREVVAKAYDQNGMARTGQQNYSIYVNTADNIFRSFLGGRDQDLKPIVQKELDAFRADAKRVSVEAASRSYIKQSFERSYNEAQLFTKVFALDAQYSTDSESAFGAIRAHRSELVNGVNIAPAATHLQAALTAAGDLTVVCHVLGWVTHEYLLPEFDDEDLAETSAFSAHSRQLAARLLAEHLWVFADALFDAEVAKSIGKVPVVPEALKIIPVSNGQAASNAYPPVKRALELLIMFDQSMPKERCQRDSPVVFKIVKETIAALQRAEAQIKSKRLSTDADLFMIKNLLILKNELLSLEIGDIRSNGDAGMQHFRQIWDALSLAQNLVGYFSTFIPTTSSLWSKATGVAGLAGGGGDKAASALSSITSPSIANGSLEQDVGEQLDDALRRSITAFTHRWGKQVCDATSRKLGGKNVAKIERELEEVLQTAFSNQPEVIAKLKEAIQIQAQAQDEQKGSKITRV